MPLDWDLDAETIYEKVTGLAKSMEQPIGYDSQSYLVPQAAMFNLTGGIIADSDVFAGEALAKFTQGELAIYIVGQYSLNALNKAMQENNLSCEIYPLGNYTDMVQYIGISRGDNYKKIGECIKFAEYLVSNSSQKKMTELKVYSVTDAIINENELAIIEDAYLTPSVPNLFEWADKYEIIGASCRRALWDKAAVAESLKLLDDNLSGRPN